LRRLLGVLAAALCAAPAAAQIHPERLYYGVDQRVPVRVDAPEDFAGELTIRLHDIATGAVVAESAAAAGRADLAGLLPILWDRGWDRAVLAQLYADSRALGAPVVVQPLLTPDTAALLDPATMRPVEGPGGQPVFESDRAGGADPREERAVVFTGLRLYVDKEVVFETTEGEVVFRMRPDAAPNTVFNLLHLVEGGFYTGVPIHRVDAELPDGRPFVIQFGDPSGTGLGGPGYHTDLEKSNLPHDFGVLSMARGADPNSNGSQVFIALSRAGTSFLDGRYTAFAEAVAGAEAIRAIAATPVGEDDRPLSPPMIVRAYTRDAPPAGTGRAGALSTATDPGLTD
jgi:peptidyl-prolyl cis-trans isomerase B (cyclophilin B)